LTALTKFLAQVRQQHCRVAFDWGFPIEAVDFIRQMQDLGVRHFWFAGEERLAEKACVLRDKNHDPEGTRANFRGQVAALKNANLPARFSPGVQIVRPYRDVDDFDRLDQLFRDQQELYGEILAAR
jgi:hypothetical protein